MTTIEAVKQHLRLDNAEEDALIQGYMAAASEYITRYTGQDFSIDVPAAVKVAFLMLVGAMYEGRQAIVLTERGSGQILENPLLHYYLDSYRANRGVM